MQPLYQNLLGVVIHALYIQTVVTVCDWAVRHNIVSLLVSRKMVHIAAACQCLLSRLFDESHWTWQLNVLVPSLYGILLVYKGLVLRDPNDVDVQTMSRTGRPIELCQGPLLFVLVMIYLGLYQFKTETGVYMMAAMGFGDGMAPVIGDKFPFGRYKTFGGDTKTLSGSAAVFVGTVIGIFVNRAGVGVPKVLYADRVLGVALVATIAESVAGKWDNLVIAASVYLYLHVTTTSLYYD